ncbi:hypothetical protein SLE2022_398880 [Rubroshorea leprosula]
MDQIEHQKLQILRQFIRSQFLRKFTKLVLSLSVFSLFFSHSSCISMLHSFKFYFQTLPLKLISHNIDKNCIFLLCNGLLVFLAKFSGLISSSSSKHNNADESFLGYEDVQHSETIVMESQVPLLENEVVVEAENGSLIETANKYIIEEVADRETDHKFLMEEEETQEREGFQIPDGEQEQEDEDDENEDFSEEEEVKGIEGSYSTVQEVEEEEEEREEGNGLLSTEELNKKFDEFIRKRKEELRIEARQQLIMVQ